MADDPSSEDKYASGNHAQVFNTTSSPQTLTVRGKEYVVDPEGKPADNVFSPPPDKDLSFMQKADYLVRGLANGLSFGLADKFAGVMDTVIHGGNLKTNIQVEQAISDPFSAPDVYSQGLGLGEFLTLGASAFANDTKEVPLRVTPKDEYKPAVPKPPVM